MWSYLVSKLGKYQVHPYPMPSRGDMTHSTSESAILLTTERCGLRDMRDSITVTYPWARDQRDSSLDAVEWALGVISLKV